MVKVFKLIFILGLSSCLRFSNNSSNVEIVEVDENNQIKMVNIYVGNKDTANVLNQYYFRSNKTLETYLRYFIREDSGVLSVYDSNIKLKSLICYKGDLINNGLLIKYWPGSNIPKSLCYKYGDIIDGVYYNFYPNGSVESISNVISNTKYPLIRFDSASRKIEQYKENTYMLKPSWMNYNLDSVRNLERRYNAYKNRVKHLKDIRISLINSK